MAALVLVVMVPIGANVISTSRYVVTADAVEEEDQVVTAGSALVEGTIDADLVIASGELFVSGTITGDLLVASNDRVVVTGVVAGSVRGVALGEFVVSGTVSGDVLIAAAAVTVDGEVSGDIDMFTSTFRLSGSVGRDVRGQMLRAEIDGDVGRDVNITVQSLELGSKAVVGGDVLYRSSQDAQVSGAAAVAGQLSRIPARLPFFANVVFAVATILSFLAFLVGGVVIFWLFRRTSAHAAAAIARTPGRALLVGLATVVLLPLAIAFLAVTLVGVPLAVFGLLVFLLGLVFGPVPAYAVFGEKLTQGKVPLVGAFIITAIIWRGALWLIPLLGLAIYVVGLVLGIGGWVLGMWAHRRGPDLVDVEPHAETPPPEEPERATSELPAWPEGSEPPLPPEPPYEGTSGEIQAAGDEDESGSASSTEGGEPGGPAGEH